LGGKKSKLTSRFEAVAHGALALTQLASVDDYLRHSYAIRLWEPYAKAYAYSPIFSKEMKYPCQSSEELQIIVKYTYFVTKSFRKSDKILS
jgi:hypothetical protein